MAPSLRVASLFAYARERDGFSAGDLRARAKLVSDLKGA